jgi:alkaline phosphatase
LYDETSFDPSIGYDAWLGGERPYPLTIVPTQDDYFQQSYSTDSGAAITAMMTGQKTDNGNICWRAGDPEDGDIRTIAEKLKKQKELSVGIVSTVPFNHATPAGVMAHNTSRYDYSSGHSDAPFGSRKKSLAEEIIEKAKPNVVIGGGHKDWISGYITDELYDGLKASSKYVFVERVEGTDGATNLLEGATLAAAQGKKLWGLFGGSGGNFESPIPSDTPGKPSFLVNPANPTMAQSVTAALTVLSADPDGFFALFEQGDLDWANHANDYSRMIGCMNDLNNAVISAIAFIRRPGDDITWNNTLMIVTADHANSYMRLNNDMILQKGDLPRQRCRLFSPKDDYPDGEVTYGTGSHTNELVTVYAKGAGTELFSKYEGNWYPKTRIIDNTNIYDIIKELTGVE